MSKKQSLSRSEDVYESRGRRRNNERPVLRANEIPYALLLLSGEA